jgi:hypothetical protein
MGELPNSEFLTACQAVGPLVIQREAGNDKLQVTLFRPYAFVGRDSDADINLDPPTATARKLCVPPEAYLQVLGGRLLCVDLRRYSRSDPSLGPRKVWLRLGESLKLDGLKVRPISGLPAKPRSVPKERLATISIKEPGGMAWTSNQPLTIIGSAAECHIRLSNPNVARFHTSLVNEPGGVWVISLCDNSSTSRNGTTPFIRRGERVELSIGNVNLEVEVSSAKSERAAAMPVNPAPIALAKATPGSMGIFPEQVLGMQQQMFTQFQSTIDQLIQTFGIVHRDHMELLRRELDRLERLDREINELRVEQARMNAKSLPTSVTVERLPPPPPPVANPNRPLVLPEPTAGAVAPPSPTPPPPAAANVHAWLDERVAALQKERQSVWSKISDFFTKMPHES